jgi:uncharacterized phiE125 gp8 family phage protein
MPTSIFWDLPGLAYQDRIQDRWWGLDLVTPPVDEPVTIADVKLQLNLDTTYWDAKVAGFLVAARQYIERVTNRVLLPQTWDFWMQRFPVGRIYLPRCPLTSVAWVKWTDTSEAQNLVDPATYTINTTGDPGSVVLRFGQIWPPGPLSPSRPVTARFTAGYRRFAGTVSVTGDGTQVGKLTGDAFDATWTAMSSILIGGASYPVASVDSTTGLTLAVPAPLANPAGYSYNLVPEPLKLAIKILAAALFSDPGCMEANGGSGSNAVRAAKALVSNYRVNTAGFAQRMGFAA